MKKKITLTIALSALFAGALAFGTIAWFSPMVRINQENPIEGSVEDEYYASGIGTAQDPFIITKPRHLYNLAWLQYLGFYNKNAGIDDHQFYFKLGDNIDMSQFDSALPPIGSELNPFIGNFDGDGYVISGLQVSNDFNDFKRHPSSISAWDNNTTHKQPHIVGFFGVIGEYPGGNKNSSYDTSINELVNTALTGINIKTVTLDSLSGIAAGYVRDSDTTDSHNVLKNVVVDDSTISLPQSGNTISYGQDINGNNLTNISEYSLVGYTNNVSSVVKASKTTYGVNIDSNIVFAASEEGNIAGWGGSVNMREMYDRLHSIWTKFNSTHTSGGVDPFKYYAAKEITLEKNGTTTVNSETSPTNNRLYSTENGVFNDSYNYYHGYYGYKQNDVSDGNKETASYTYVIEESNGDENYMQLTGKKDVTIPGGQSLTTNYWDTFYGSKISITINGTTYYLKTNGNNDVTATTIESEASLWMFENNRIYTEINEVQYFLNRNNTTVNLGTTANSTWNYNSTFDGYYTTNAGTDYYLNCSTTDWNLTTITPGGYVLLSDGNNHYITHESNNTVGVTTDSTNANAKWYVNGSNYRTTTNGNYYLRADGNANGSNNSIEEKNMSIATTNSNRFALNNDGYFYISYRARIGGTNRNHYAYAYFNGSAWKATVASGSDNVPNSSKTRITVTNVSDSLGEGASGVSFSSASTNPSYIKRQSVNNVDTSISTYHTYFPLREEENKPGIPDISNTGYVVSGANYWGDPYGDIRVSKYSRSTYLSGYSNGSLTTVYTINASGNRATVNANNFRKYAAAKASMESVLSGDANIYGLHFMNASINYGGNNPVIVEKAIVNGVTYYDYELPTDCVDFNLKERGFINFFAGTYFSSSLSGSTVTNDSFFSLNEVVRNGNSISEIREIDGIYEDLSDTSEVKSYVYKYTNNTYSVPFRYTNGIKTKLDGTQYVEHSTQNSLPSGYTLSFATSRIKKQNSLTQKYAYYFEIPMNEGEYCLGSVSNGTGAYLMYLDIAANASKTNRTIVYERFKLTESTYRYPSGVSLKSLDASVFVYDDEEEAFASIDASDSACMVIKANATGDFSMDRNGNDVALTRAQTANAPPNYSGEDIFVHDDNSQTELVITAISESNRWVKQMEYYDYMVISDTLVVTTITDLSTDENGTSYIRQSIVQKTYGGNSTSGTLNSAYVYVNGGTDERSSMKIYNHSNNGRRYSDGDLTNTTTLNIADGKLRPGTDANIVLVFKLFQNGGDSYSDSSTISVVGDATFAASGTYFTYNGFTIVITPESGTINIKVITYNPSFTMTVTNTANGSSTSSSKTTIVTINGTTITSEGQTITINP